MSVRQQKRREGGEEKLFWIVDIEYRHPDGRTQRIRRVPRVQTKRAAEQLEREILAKLAAGTFGKTEPKAEVPTLQSFSEEFERVYAQNNNKPSERASKEAILRLHLRPAFGSKRLDAITPHDVERFKAAQLRAGRSPKTINNQLTVLRKLLAVAREWGHPVPPLPIKWLKSPKPGFDFFDFDEAARLLAASPEGTFGAMIALALHTGLRQGELLALEWQDCDLVAGRLLVRRAIVRGVIGTPKSGVAREVPLNDDAIALLERHKSLRRLVFTPAGADRHLTKGECKHPLWGACRRAGLRELGWHALRHTFASHLVMRGAPLKAVQELLGHATIEMTMRYAHLAPAARREAVQLLASANGHGAATAAEVSRSAR